MRNLFLIVFLTSIFITKSRCQEKSIPVVSTVFNKTDDYLEEMIDSLKIVGLNYAVLIDGEVVHKKAFGLANIELQVTMDLNKVFAVASISKLFSSIALLDLLNIHDLNVNETVGDLLPDRVDLPSSWNKLTLRLLLSHTSGIPDQIDYQIYLAPESEEFVIEVLKDKPFSSKPGMASKYNATGFLLVRIIIEKLAKQDFESYMQEYFFDQFGLSSAKYGGFKKVIPKRVTCYENVSGELEMFPLNYSSPMYAGAGLNISINDLITWFQAILNEQILTGEQLKNIWTPVKLDNGKYGSFGLGWEAYKLQQNNRIVGHGGAGISSFRHYWNEHTKRNVSVILLTNGAYNWLVRPNEINWQIANIILAD